MNDSSSLLAVENLSVSFLEKDQRYLKAVDNVSFSIQKQTILGVVGESGCGKSVTALALMGLLEASSSHVASNGIWFEGQNLFELEEKRMRRLRGNRVSMIFQDPMTSLNPVYSIGNQIAEVFTTHRGLSYRDAQKLVVEALQQVQIPEAYKRFHEYPHQLSGGMRQRVMIAMALACKPSLLIADEPTTALDVTIQAQILSLMRDLQEENGMSILFITHDLGVVAELCDDVMVMYAGQVVEKATVREIFLNPQHPYTQGLLKATPRLGEYQEKLFAIPGNVPSLGHWPHGCRFQDRCPYVTDACRQKEIRLFNTAGPGQSTHDVRCILVDPNEGSL